jgi:hypothetical protein
LSFTSANWSDARLARPPSEGGWWRKPGRVKRRGPLAHGHWVIVAPRIFASDLQDGQASEPRARRMSQQDVIQDARKAATDDHVVRNRRIPQWNARRDFRAHDTGHLARVAVMRLLSSTLPSLPKKVSRLFRINAKTSSGKAMSFAKTSSFRPMRCSGNSTSAQSLAPALHDRSHNARPTKQWIAENYWTVTKCFSRQVQPFAVFRWRSRSKRSKTPTVSMLCPSSRLSTSPTVLSLLC